VTAIQMASSWNIPVATSAFTIVKLTWTSAVQIHSSMPGYTGKYIGTMTSNPPVPSLVALSPQAQAM